MFPSPYGVSFILIIEAQWKNKNIGGGFRLLTEYHSFLFTGLKLSDYYDGETDEGFRLLTEYHSFLFVLVSVGRILYEFPSPYGVSFILISKL